VAPKTSAAYQSWKASGELARLWTSDFFAVLPPNLGVSNRLAGGAIDLADTITKTGLFTTFTGGEPAETLRISKCGPSRFTLFILP
jgi:hypothetical protein